MREIQRLKELTEYLNKCRDAYYNQNKPLISDYEYDNLFDELGELENKMGISLTNSPTKTVGYEVKSELKKVKHSHPMLSLGKTKSVDELRKFIGNKDYLLTCKMDGLTVLLTYENGVLVKAETRGNGEIGEDITHNAKVFENIPLTIPYKEHLEIEGEAIITFDDFERINDKLPEDARYKNPRNLVSGSVRQLDNRIAKVRHIKFIAWKVPTNIYNSFSENLNYINELGFTVVPCILTNDTEHLEDLIQDRKDYATQMNYPIDGLVVTYDDIKYGESLGMTGHHPKHSIAFKFYDEEVETKLLDIEFSMGKTGILTPVAIFEPVEIDGTMVERASLHNLSVMAETLKCEAFVGQTVFVVKKNQIIPQIVNAETIMPDDAKVISIPSVCPVCGAETKVVQDNATEVLACSNPSCKGKLLGRVSHYVSNKGMDIVGLSEETLKKFIDLGWINNLADIYKLPTHFDRLKRFDGFGSKSVEKLAASIEKSKTTTLQKFISALSIPCIGRSQSKILAKKFKAWRDFCDAGKQEIMNYDFSCIEGFGEIMDKNIHEWFETMYIDDQIEDIVKELTFEEEEVSTSSIDLAGKTFVITGSVHIYKNRDELKAFIEAANGKVSGSVSKNTFALINNDKESNSSKNKKARDLGIKIISEEEFVERYAK